MAESPPRRETRLASIKGTTIIEDEVRSGRQSELKLKELRRVVKADPFQSAKGVMSTPGTLSGSEKGDIAETLATNKGL
ncbi:hypothetical protein RB195_012262 [Necator americanus]|uniref:Uncharacterized protein n=1 Tax=Necator americanus TaxID=51031 RepID=A0ABR1D695_NECAM